MGYKRALLRHSAILLGNSLVRGFYFSRCLQHNSHLLRMIDPVSQPRVVVRDKSAWRRLRVEEASLSIPALESILRDELAHSEQAPAAEPSRRINITCCASASRLCGQVKTPSGMRHPLTPEIHGRM
jgi:hypothetical protein